MSTEAKTVTLSLGERIAALKIFDQFKGSMVTMKALLEDVKQLPVTEEEWKTANLVKTPIKGQDGSEQEQWKWDETVSKDVTFQPETVEYLTASIKAKSDAGEISLSDVALVSLSDKLK